MVNIPVESWSWGQY